MLPHSWEIVGNLRQTTVQWLSKVFRSFREFCKTNVTRTCGMAWRIEPRHLLWPRTLDPAFEQLLYAVFALNCFICGIRCLLLTWQWITITVVPRKYTITLKFPYSLKDFHRYKITIIFGVYSNTPVISFFRFSAGHSEGTQSMETPRYKPECRGFDFV
jgi:hypothetical protein